MTRSDLWSDIRTMLQMLPARPFSNAVARHWREPVAMHMLRSIPEHREASAGRNHRIIARAVTCMCVIESPAISEGALSSFD